MEFDLKMIGLRCRNFRIAMGIKQARVAVDTGYSVENISSFERGHNDNARILLWYLVNGLSVKKLMFDEGEYING